MQGFIYKIRFPIMTHDELDDVVEPTHVLTEEELNAIINEEKHDFDSKPRVSVDSTPNSLYLFVIYIYA